MSLTIELPEETERDLATYARSHGRTAEAVVLDMIERHLASRMLDEALAPFRRDVAESGMSEVELDAFFEEVRDEVWQEQQARKT